MGQDQPRVIILIILIELAYPMIHLKFQIQPSSSSVEEDFLRFLLYMGVTAMCDPKHFHSSRGVYEILFQSVQWF